MHHYFSITAFAAPEDVSTHVLVWGSAYGQEELGCSLGFLSHFLQALEGHPVHLPGPQPSLNPKAQSLCRGVSLRCSEHPYHHHLASYLCKTKRA